MSVLLLVRHGQASVGTSDYDRLSGLGHRQARAVGTRLARVDATIGRVLCGGLVRQRDTALGAMTESGATGTHLLTFNDHAHLEADRALISYR